jgi:hypothetical protein
MDQDKKGGDTGGPDELLTEWRVHLLVEQPGKSVALCAFCVLAVVLIHFLFRQRVGFTVLAAAILLGSLSDWFLPVKYRLTTAGASYTNLVFRKRMAWEEVRSCYVSSSALKLSPFSRRTRLDAFRGVVLRFAGNRDEVIRIVQERATHRQR